MDRSHEVRDLSLSGNKMRLVVDGRAYDIDISRHSTKLAAASQEQKSQFIVSASGYGIHWPSIDEDLSIDALIGISHECPVGKATH